MTKADNKENANGRGMGAMDHIAHATVCLLTFVAPWGIYALLPLDTSHLADGNLFTSLILYSVPGLLVVVLPGVAVLRLAATRRWPLPLELTWPLAMLALAGFFGTPFFFVEGAGTEYAVAKYVAAVHFIPGLMTLVLLLCVPHWQTVRTALWLHALSGAVVGILYLLGYFLLLIPVNIAFGSDTVSPLTPGTLLGWGAAALFVACTRISPAWMRATAVCFAFAIVAVHLFFFMPFTPSFATNFSIDPAFLLALGLTCWFVARVVAKAWLRSKETGMESAAYAKHKSALLAVSALLPILFVQKGVFAHFDYVGLVLPLLAAYVVCVDRAEGLAAPAPRRRPVALVVCAVLPLLGYNVFNVSPHALDTRNYQSNAAIADTGQYAFLSDVMLHVNLLYPGERITHYRLARARLAHGDADGSVAHYLKSLEPGNPVIIKEYPESLRQAYLAELRDAASTLEQEQPGLPYERVLLATGERAAAMSLLELKAGKHAEDDAPHDRALMLWVLGNILGRTDTRVLFEDWPDERLHGLLRQQATVQTEAGSGAPRALSLLVREDRVEFEVWREGTTLGGSFLVPVGLDWKLKDAARLSAAEVDWRASEIDTPLFTITLGDTPAIRFKGEAKPQPESPFLRNIHPFTRRVVLLAP